MEGSGFPGRAPSSFPADRQGAFENFLASAIATVLTIIFSWRLLLDSQDSKPLAIEGAGAEGGVSEPDPQRGHASEQKLHNSTQVNIDPKSVSKETLQSDSASSKVKESSYSQDKSLTSANHAGFDAATRSEDEDDSHEHVRYTQSTWMDSPNQYLPAAGKATQNNGILRGRPAEHQHTHLDSVTKLLPRPSWALDLDVTPVSIAPTPRISYVSDSSSDDAETEGDVSSDSTLEGDAQDADHSDSDSASLTNSSHSGRGGGGGGGGANAEAREFNVVGEPLGDDDSESEFCVVFNNMLEAITEEDTDDMSEIEKDKSAEEEDQVDTFVSRTKMQSPSSSANLDSSAVESNKLSSGELTSGTNSIDGSIDTHVPARSESSSAVHGGRFINTHRPLLIGPQRDETSRASQGPTRLPLGAASLTADTAPTDGALSPTLEDKPAGYSRTSPALPMASSEFSYLERARAIIWGSGFAPDLPEGRLNSSIAARATRDRSPLDLHSSSIQKTNNVYLSSTETQRHVEQTPIQSTFDSEIEDRNYGLDQSQGEEEKDASEESESSVMSARDQSVSHERQQEDSGSKATKDSVLDSLIQRHDQLKKVATDRLERSRSTSNQESVNKEQIKNTLQDPNVSKGDDEIGTWSGNSVREVRPDTQSPLFQANFDNNKSPSDGEHGARVFADGSIDNKEDQSADKLGKFADAPLSAVSRDEKSAREFTFVRTTNVERTFLVRNAAAGTPTAEGARHSSENPAGSGGVENADKMSEYSSSYSELASYDKRANTQSPLVWNGSPVHGRYPRAQAGQEAPGSHGRHGRRGPIEERTVGVFSVRPHVNYDESDLQKRFPGPGDESHHEHSREVAPDAESLRHGNVAAEMDRSHSGQGLREHWADPDLYPQRNDVYKSSSEIERIYTNGRPNHLDLNALADRETSSLSGNLVAHQDLRETPGGDARRVVATSSALARRGDQPPDPSLPYSGSAMASTEAVAENPYVAVARATARAATIASANAAAGVTSGSNDSDSADDISVVVSTSCTIKRGDPNTPTDSSPRLSFPTDTSSVSSTREILPPPQQKKKMTITIEESQDPSRREYRTLECEVPKTLDGDVTAMISEAVKRIIASQSSLSHQRGSQLNSTIDNITRQVVSAYSAPPEPWGRAPPHPVSPPHRLALGDSEPVKGTTIPEFRAQNTSPTLYFPPPRARQPAHVALQSNSDLRPGAYLSRVINPLSDPDKSMYFNDDDSTVFYVTGKNPSTEKPKPDDFVLKVVTDKKKQPSVEPVLSESESDRETPLTEHRRHRMKEIKEEQEEAPSGALFPGDDEKIKKKKPARPKLTQPSADLKQNDAANRTELRTNGDTTPSPAVPDKTMKGILKPRPHPRSTVETERKPLNQQPVAKSKSNEDLTSANRQQLPRNSLEKSTPKETGKKPYKSILLTPVKKVEKKKKKPPVAAEPKSASPVSPAPPPETKPVVQTKTAKPSRTGVPVAIPNTRPTRIDIEFDRRQKEFRARTPSPKSNLVMVDIDIGGEDPKQRSRSVENLKERLSRARPRAPSTEHIDQHWEGVSERLSRSQERMLERGFRSREDSFCSASSQPGDLRRSASMGSLHGQFFLDRRSYTSLIETDLDTGISTEIPLIHETNVDDLLNKSKSMSSLNTATSFRTYDIYSDDSHYKSCETISNPSTSSSQRDKLNQVPVVNGVSERSLSAHELRISESLSKMSVPEWFRAQDSTSKPVELIHTKTPPRTPYELPPTTTAKRPKSLTPLQILPSKPIIASHRVSSSRSPGSSTCSTPVSGPQNFELPSAKFRQRRDDSLSPIRIKTPDEMPPLLPPRDYPHRESARESYLKLKARTSPELWGPLSPTHAPTSPSWDAQTQDDRSRRAGHAKSSAAPAGQRARNNPVPPLRQEETDVSRKQKNFTPGATTDPSSAVSESKRRNYLGESSDSGVGSLDQRQDTPVHLTNNQSFSPGRTVSNLVQDLKIEPAPNSPQRDVGVEPGTTNGPFQQMISTLDTKRKEIETKATVISTETPHQQKPRQTAEATKENFPVLSLTSSPGSKRRSFRSTDSLRSAKDSEPSRVTMTLSKPTFRQESRNEARVLDVKKKSTNSLDELLGGLLAIPPPRGSPDDEEEDFNEEDQNDPGEMQETPKERNFRILKQAHTPRANENYLGSPVDEGTNDMADEVDEESVLIYCRNSKCRKSTKLPEARESYKTCHNCFTYYCSRECRKSHWERHKKQCLFSRINSGCKHVVKKAMNDDALAEELSKLARTGYLTKGRGCVMLVFPTPAHAELFLNKGFAAVPNAANFANIKEVQEEADIFGEHEVELLQMCKSYNPELRYVLEVAIVAGQAAPTWPVPRRAGPVIQKCAKVRLHSQTAAREAVKKDASQATLVLTAVPGAEFTENMDERKAREICLVNIQRQLRQKGVSLRHEYPEVYTRLCAYVADNAHFSPISLYPKDSTTGKRFMCLIMPNSEPEVNWMYSPGLIEDLNLHPNI